MKIVVTGTRGIPNIMGGVEMHCEELFPRIAQYGVDVTLIRRRYYANDVLKEWKGVKLVDIDAPKQQGYEAFVHTFKAVNMAKRLHAEIVHIHAIGPALLVPYAKLLGLKVVLTHHGPDYDREKWDWFSKKMLKLGEYLGCKFADDVIVISDVIKNLIKKKYGRTKNVHLIYNGVSDTEVCDYPEFFEELGIEKGKYILGMCRFVPEKNLHHLVEAFAKVKNEERRAKNSFDDVKLVLAGDTDFEDGYSRKLKDKARENGVVLTGFIKGRKLHSLLTNCRAYCLPSSHEGLPIALLEAMSYGVKVIVSDIPANLEVGLDSNDYFPVGNVKALAEKLKEVMEQTLRHIDYDMKKYDWDKIAGQVMEVYERLLER